MSINSPAVHFIDANLIMYAMGDPHALRDPCKKIFEKIRDGKIFVATDTEVLQEILPRYFSISRMALGEMAYRSLVQICLTVFLVTLQDTAKALELLKTDRGISSRDAIHAATMLNNGLKKILSTDSHFDRIPEIKRIDPTKFR